jgi:hypothetical protein
MWILNIIFYRSMACGPISLYSALDTHISWKVPRDARMEPPIHAENSRSISDAVRILGLNAAGTRVSVSQYKRLDRPDRREPPPVRTTGNGERGRGRWGKIIADIRARKHPKD